MDIIKWGLHIVGIDVGNITKKGEIRCLARFLWEFLF